MDNVNPVNMKEPGNKKLQNIIFAVIAAVVAFSLVTFLNNTREDDPNKAAEDLLSSTENREYVSAGHSFRATFPGFPEMTADILDVSGVKVPYTLYVKEADDSSYMVGVVEYPEASFDFSTVEKQRASLDGSVNGSAQSISGNVVSTEFTTFAGRTAIFGHIRASREGREFDYYTTNFLVGNRLYQITSVNASKSNYDTFANSFKLQD